MKTNTRIIIVFVLITHAGLTSCIKENNIDSMEYKTMLLVQKSWKFEGYGIDENNNGIIEAAENSMQACEADDVFTFYPDCTGIYARGTIQCSGSETEPLTINFDWRFMNHGTELAIFAAPEMINRLDENFLEVYYMDENSLGQPVKFIRRFRH